MHLLNLIEFNLALLDTHPGLEFLKATPEFQERYSELFYTRIKNNTFLIASLNV
jgi:hypothetical protein